MRISAIVVIYFLLLGSAFAQPTRQVLSGPNFLMEGDSAFGDSSEVITPSFLPQSMSASADGNILTNKPGFAMLSSAIIPGSGQIANKKWGRAAAYLLVEAASVWYYIDQTNAAKSNEKAYEQYADQNWSPLAYAQWLVAYSEANGLNGDLDALNDLKALVSNLNPDFDHTPNDWVKLGTNGLSLVRSVEVRTPFILEDGTRKSEFSHVLKDFGSQQYYELMSKYYQFQPGWQDFFDGWQADGANHVYMYPWNNSMITPNFMEGRDRAEEFNDNYRKAGNIVTLIMVNHLVSAFDAFFTVKLKNSRIEPSTAYLHEGALSVTWHF